MAISITEFESTLTALSEALALDKTDITRDASVQRFKLCVELAWKSSKDTMGTSTTAPKQVVREMAQAGLIDNVSFWLDSIDKRNLSIYAYKDKLSEAIFEFAKIFLPEARKLLARLKAE